MKHIQNEKQNALIIPEWLFQEPRKPRKMEDKPRKMYTSKPLQLIAKSNFKIDDKQLNKVQAKGLFRIILLIEHYKLYLIILWKVIISIIPTLY